MNNNFGISEKSYILLIEAIIGFPEIEKAVIFGSRAMGNYKPGSDIDLAIFGKNITFETISRLHGKLNEQLPIPYFVDVVNYTVIELESLKQHILDEGKEIFSKEKI